MYSLMNQLILAYVLNKSNKFYATELLYWSVRYDVVFLDFSGRVLSIYYKLLLLVSLSHKIQHNFGTPF